MSHQHTFYVNSWCECGVDQASLTQEMQNDLTMIDMYLARRSALDGFDSRIQKIQHAVNVASKADVYHRALKGIMGFFNSDCDETIRQMRGIAERALKE